MADLYVLASIPDQGKTTTAILLEKKLKSDGKKVACLQINKGPRDVHRYLFENCYHYSIPLEASQSKNAFEQWVPRGYDSYIFEIPLTASPVYIAYIDLFTQINEVVDSNLAAEWKSHVTEETKKTWDKRWYPSELSPALDLMWYWKIVHEKTLKMVLTKVPQQVDGPCVDLTKQLHHADQMVKEKINPQMNLPNNPKKNVIAVGSFPAEYWNIFPNLRWFQYDYAAFMKSLRAQQFDLAIEGICGANTFKLQSPSDQGTIICYQPTVYLNIKKRISKNPLQTDLPSIFSTIKTSPIGTPLSGEGEPLSGYNNKYWVHRYYERDEPVWKDKNTVFCNGWVLPQYLIRDGYLEVN